MIETLVAYFRQRFYIPEIQKLVLHLPHIHIIGTRYCVNTRHEVFNCRASYQDLLFCLDYAEHVVAIFAHQIQSEYCAGNRYL